MGTFAIIETEGESESTASNSEQIPSPALQEVAEQVEDEINQIKESTKKIENTSDRFTLPWYAPSLAKKELALMN